MTVQAYFLQDGCITRVSKTRFSKTTGKERLLVIKDDEAKKLLWFPEDLNPYNTKTLYSDPIGFPYSRIPQEVLLSEEEYLIPEVTKSEIGYHKLLSSILEGLKETIPTSLQENYELLQENLKVQSQFATYWGRVVYTEGGVLVTEGEGLTLEVLDTGKLKVVFEEKFNDTASFSVWVSFETPDLKYSVEPDLEANSCTLILKNIVDNEYSTEATFSVLVKGRLA